MGDLAWKKCFLNGSGFDKSKDIGIHVRALQEAVNSDSTQT